LLEQAGIEKLVIVPFNKAFSDQTADEYIGNFLVKNFQPHTIIIGYDHRFGKNRSGDYKMLEKYAEKNKLSLTPSIGLIKENDYAIGALQDARSLVRWAFEAKKGDVSEPFSIGDQFVVATLERIVPKGLQDAATAKSGCEVMIRKKKKAEIISKKLGSNPTLESAAAAYNKQVQLAGADSSITFNASIINGIGMEPKIVGASFNKAYQNKVSPVIEGTTGVFVMKVNGIQSKAAETAEALQQRISSRSTALRNQTGSWFEGLRKQADIKDERSKHF
jgi:peptidyl-prolyl cis-trans isomerase D